MVAQVHQDLLEPQDNVDHLEPQERPVCQDSPASRDMWASVDSEDPWARREHVERAADPAREASQEPVDHQERLEAQELMARMAPEDRLERTAFLDPQERQETGESLEHKERPELRETKEPRDVQETQVSMGLQETKEKAV